MARYILHAADGMLHAVDDPAGYDGPEWRDLGEIEIDPAFARFDTTLDTVVDDLVALRKTRNAEATAYRDQRIVVGGQTSFGVAQIDAESRGLIDGLVSMADRMAKAGLPFQTRIRLIDNSYALIADADEMGKFGMEYGGYVLALFAASFVVKDLIDAAPDKAAIDAVDITAGYPA